MRLDFKKVSENIYLLFLICYIFSIVNGIIFNYLDKLFPLNSTQKNGLENLTGGTKFIFIMILVPIIETFIFQYFPNKILKLFKFNNFYVLLIIPVIIFSSMHFYNYIYVAMTFIGGLFLNFFFLKAKEKTNFYLILTILFHSLYNLFGYLFIV
ncbi:hypothetical protein HDC90_000691 [Pedobacter sp. AK013]|uniref:CPBP family glutamic-type intramembrane protease n=1 Tax=Pedobacter sp. AK013 TaxID=2723071 RepID=UPI001611A17A|nr:hypothetical protein [Pedobacter sp. AK013]